MKTGLIKTFLTALAGSVALMVALVLMNNMRPATVVEASPAVASPALAAVEASKLTSITISHIPDNIVYGMDKDGVSKFVVTRTNEALNQDYIATLMVNNMPITKPNSTELLTIPLPAGVDPIEVPTPLAPNNESWDPGTYWVTATVYQTGTVLGEVYHNVTIAPFIGWDSSVRNMASMRLGDVLSAAVKIQPAVNYMSDTNEVVEYDFDGDGTPEGGVTIDGTNSYTKATAPNATYVFTEYLYTKAATYTVNAHYQYNSGVYGKPTNSATTVVTVVNPGLDLMIHGMKATDVVTPEIDHTKEITKGMSGDTVELVAKVDASEGLTPTLVEFKAGEETIATIPVSGTEAMTTIVLSDVTTPTVVTMTAVLVSPKFGEGDGDMKVIVATEPISVVVDPKPAPPAEPCPVSIALAATPASPIKTGETYTATATLTEQAAETCKVGGVEGKQVDFTSTLGTPAPASAATDASGVATTTLTSAVTGTATLTATFGEAADGIDLVFEPVEVVDDGIEIESGGTATFEDETNPENNVVIEMPAGSVKVKAKCTLMVELPTKPSGVRIREVGNAFTCNFKTMDGKPYTGTVKMQFRRLVAPATAMLADATVPTTRTNLIGLGVNQGDTWDILSADSVSQPDANNLVTASVNVATPSSTDTYARLTANKVVYLPMVPKNLN